MLETFLIILVVFFDTMLTWAILGILMKKISGLLSGNKEDSKGFGSTIIKIICALIAFIYGGFLAYIHIKNNFSFELTVLFFLMPIIIFLLLTIIKMMNGNNSSKELK